MLALRNLANDMRTQAANDTRPHGRAGRFADVMERYLRPAGPSGRPAGELAAVFDSLRRHAAAVAAVAGVVDTVRRQLLPIATARHEMLGMVLSELERRNGGACRKGAREDLLPYLEHGERVLAEVGRVLPRAEAVGAHAERLGGKVEGALRTGGETVAGLRRAVELEGEGTAVVVDLGYASREFDRLGGDVYRAVVAAMDEGWVREFDGDYAVEGRR